MNKRILLGFLLLPFFAISQHAIKGVFTPAEDYKNAILYKVTPSESLYISHAEIAEDGTFEILLDSTVTKGMYRLVYAAPQEEHNFDIIYTVKETINLTFSQDKGVEFQTSAENILSTSYAKSMSLVSESIGNYFRQKSTDTAALQAIFKTQKETQINYEEAAKDTEIAIHFIKANKPFVPEKFENVDNYIDDLKTHFFDHIDFNDEVLQSSNFLIDRAFNYVMGMTSDKDQSTTFKNNITDVALAMKDANPTIKKTVLELLWEQFGAAGFDDVANYISENYLMQVAKALNNEALTHRLQLYKNLSIGNKAPDFFIEQTIAGEKTLQKLSDLETAENYIVVFWSSTCGHCLDELPQLQTYLETQPKEKFQVVAFAIEHDNVTWEKEIKNFSEFTHVIGLNKWSNKVARSYDVRATPTYFLLDKSKNIIAKPEDFEGLKEILQEKE